MSCKSHGDPQWKRNPSKSTKLKNKQISHLFLCLCFPPKIDFCKEHLLLNSTTHWYVTSYLTQSSLELLLFHYRPPIMVLYNRLQSHCHLSRCRCNRTSRHDQYRCYMKYMQQGQFYWVFWFTAQLSSKRQRPLRISNARSTTDLASLSFLLNSRSSGGRWPLFGYGLTSYFSSG